MPTRAQHVAAALEAMAPRHSGNANDELGFLVGDPGQVIRGVACMWNAHTRSIERAAAAGLDMLLVHELPYFAAAPSHWINLPASEQEIGANRARRALFERHRMVVYRAHSNWDALAVDGVPDQAVRALGLGELTVVASEKYFKVHRLSAPMRVADLAERARVGLGMPWPPRVFGDPERRVETFAFLIGGFGTIFNTPQVARRAGAQAILVGEFIEWTLIHALELDLPVVVTLHSLSEIPAIKRQAELLGERFPDLPVKHIGSGALDF
jgi:putative NIF3 family GTP cyclohydrolase 1 type 2